MEIYKQYKDTIYEISNTGKIRNMNTNKELKTQDKKGYNKVSLHIGKNRKRKAIHVMVAEMFLDKNDFKYAPSEKKEDIDINKLQVNHKDGNKKNNNVDNLEWCTSTYNIEHSYRIGIRKTPCRIPIVMKEENGIEQKFDSKYQCARYLKSKYKRLENTTNKHVEKQITQAIRLKTRYLGYTFTQI